MKIVRQEGQPNNGCGLKAVGFMTISTAITDSNTMTHTKMFRNGQFYADCKHQIL